MTWRFEWWVESECWSLNFPITHQYEHPPYCALLVFLAYFTCGCREINLPLFDLVDKVSLDVEIKTLFFLMIFEYCCLGMVYRHRSVDDWVVDSDKIILEWNLRLWNLFLFVLLMRVLIRCLTKDDCAPNTISSFIFLIRKMIAHPILSHESNPMNAVRDQTITRWTRAHNQTYKIYVVHLMWTKFMEIQVGSLFSEIITRGTTLSLWIQEYKLNPPRFSLFLTRRGLPW